MSKVNMQEFLDKIGVTLPEPRVMEGFGMELPGVYLTRCMDILIPAVEKSFNNQKEIVVQDFLDYVRQYNGGTTVKSSVEEKNVPVADKVVETIVQDMIEEIPVNLNWNSMSMKEKGAVIRKWLNDHPGESRVSCAKALCLTESTIYRCLALSSNDYTGNTYKRKKKTVKPNDGKMMEIEKTKVKEKPEVVTSVIIDPTPSQKTTSMYKEGGYMASLRARYENRDNPQATSLALEIAKHKDEEKDVTLDLKVPFLQSYFDGLSKEKKIAAIKCNWNNMMVSSVHVQHLSNRLLEKGASIKKEKLTVLEYNALNSLLVNSYLTGDELIAHCNGYLGKT